MFEWKNLNLDIYADGADVETIIKLNETPTISGFTTNPTLMHKAGIRSYVKFAEEVLNHVKQKPISFEVFTDDLNEMISQARIISSWGENVIVKIPVTNSKGASTTPVIKILNKEGIPVNVTAIFTQSQISDILDAIDLNSKNYLSIFAGRIADTGRNPVPILKYALDLTAKFDNIKIIWASPRELLNIFQAEEIGCDILTATSDILEKMKLVGKDLQEYSLETVKMFHDDAMVNSYIIN